MTTNEAREVQKILDVLYAVSRHLGAKDQMNAALHMAAEVRPTPLAVSVQNAIATADLLLSECLPQPVNEEVK